MAVHGFNPRPREEGDVIACHGGKLGRSFNPRPREEGDGIGYNVLSPNELGSAFREPGLLGLSTTSDRRPPFS